MSIVIAMVPLARGARLSSTALLADLTATWGTEIDRSTVDKKSGTIGFDLGDGYYTAIGMMPGPIPEIEGPASTTWMWPQAVAELADHRGHLIITVGTQGEGHPLNQRRMLTRVAASVLAACPGAVGVSWGPSGFLVTGPAFRDLAIAAFNEQNDAPPLYLWVDFRVGETGRGRSGGFTVGLRDLGLMEIEAPIATDSPGELRQRMMSLAAYLLENGPIINDGDTVGATRKEKIRVVHAASQFGHERQVMRLEYR